MANQPQLVVALSARLDQFEKQMTQAGTLAADAVGKIEDQFAKLNPQLPANFGSGMVAGLGIFTGAALTQGITKFVGGIFDSIEALAKLGAQAKLTGQDVEEFQRQMFVGTRAGRSSAEAADDLTKVAALLNDAQRNENSLTAILDANNLKYKDRNGALISTTQLLRMAADLIRNAGSELDKVQIAKAFHLPDDWIKTLEKGGAAFDKLMADAEQFGGVASRELIAKAAEFERNWTAAIQNLGQGSKEWLLPLIQVLNEAIRLAGEIGPVAARAARGVASEIATNLRIQEGKASLQELLNLAREVETKGGILMRGTTISPQLRQKIEDAAERQREASRGGGGGGILDDSEAAREAARAKALSALRSGPVTKIPTKATADESADAFDRATESVQRHVAQLQADNAAIGLSAAAHEQLRVELKLLEAARQVNEDITDDQIASYARLRTELGAVGALQAAGIKLTDDQSAAFLRLSNVSLSVAQQLEKNKLAFQGVNDAMRFAGNQLIDVIDRATQKGAKFGDIMADVMRSVSREMLRAAITGEGAFAKMFGTSSSTGGVGGIAGVISSLFKSGPTATVGIAGSMPVPTFAEGGTIPAGGMAYVGEHGPNPRLIRAGAEPIMVTPNDVSRGSGGTIVGPSTSITIEGNADRSTVALMQQMLAARDRRFVADVAHATTELRRRSAFA